MDDFQTSATDVSKGLVQLLFDNYGYSRSQR